MAKRPSKPEFYVQFMESDFFPDANKITKYQASYNYWMFKTGKKIYKVKKHEDVQSSASLEEIFSLELIRRLQAHSPELQAELATIKQDQQGFRLDHSSDTSSPVLYYVTIMNQLADRYFLDNLIAKGRLKEKTLTRVSQFLCRLHETAERSPSKTDGTSDSLLQKLNDLIYQSKKYLGETITQPMIDMTLHPLEKYISDNRKTLLRRGKRGLVKEVHGCFIPRKINADKDTVVALGKTSDPLRDRYYDVVSDVADLTVALIHAGENDLADFFANAYCKHSDDEEAKSILPIYQAMKCLSQGLQYSITFKQFDAEIAEEKKTKATAYYEQAISIVHQL